MTIILATTWLEPKINHEKNKFFDPKLLLLEQC